jgi:hypothetical protein
VTLAKAVVRSLTPAARLFRADVRRFSHVINKDGVLGTHSSRRKGDPIAQSPLEAVGSLSELINERGRSLIQIIEPPTLLALADEVIE